MTVQCKAKARVLVVDDEPDVLQSLQDVLRTDGYQVDGADGLTQALEQARRCRPDLVVADLRLAGGDGLELIDRLRQELGELPAIIVTGAGDADLIARATRSRPVEVLTKPVDVDRLRQAVREELQRREQYARVQRRTQRLRQVARNLNRRRKGSIRTLASTCLELTSSFRKLQGHAERQEVLIRYQNDLLACSCEDDVFRRLFALFVQRSGPVFGAAMLCDENAELQLIGRFGVPGPDGLNFCRRLSLALLPLMLERPELKLLDATDNLTLFPDELRRMLIGVTVLGVPLMAGEGEIIGLVALYRKGEQPFTEDDVELARLIGAPTAAAAQKA